MIGHNEMCELGQGEREKKQEMISSMVEKQLLVFILSFAFSFPMFVAYFG